MSQEKRRPLPRAVAKSPADARFLVRFDKFMRLPIVLSALIPLIVTPKPDDLFADVVNIVAWLVFLLDLVVRSRHMNRYLASRFGIVDLLIVVATSPWYLLPGVHLGSLIVVFRLARIVRLILEEGGARHLAERLGRVAILAAVVVLSASYVAYRAEHPVNPEYGTYTDSLWWGYVTLTTVGYGDVVPITSVGRWAGVAIMTTGLAVLGLLSGSLASFFHLTADQQQRDDANARKVAGYLGQEIHQVAQRGTEIVAPTPDHVEALQREVTALREDIHRLTAHVTAGGEHHTRPAGHRPPPDSAGSSQGG